MIRGFFVLFSQIAEDIIFLFGVAGKTLRSHCFRKHPLGFAVGFKFFVSPASCAFVPDTVFDHYINMSSVTFSYVGITFNSFQHIKNKDGAIGEVSGCITAHCFFICIDVMKTAGGLKGWIIRAY